MEWLLYIFGSLLFMTSFFLIVVVLLQRGKGGGLVGALGGSGGQSAFGTKFGDRLMWVTYGVAVFWILLILFSILLLSKTSDPFGRDGGKGGSDKAGVIGDDPATDAEAKKEAAAKEDAAKTDVTEKMPEEKAAE